MRERPDGLKGFLDDVQRRYTWRARLRAWSWGAAAAAVVVLAGWTAVALVAEDGLPLLLTGGLVLALAAFALGRALWNVRRRPSERQIARYIEEAEPDLDDVVVTAVEYAQRADASPRMREVLVHDAAAVLARQSHPHRIVSPDSLRHAALGAAAASVVLMLAAVAFAPSMARAANVASAYLFPARVVLDVSPGTTKVRAGQPLTIAARLAGLSGEVVPYLTMVVGDTSRTVRMPASDDGGFAVTIASVTSGFAYSVRAGASTSEAYAVSVVRPPRVERIDLRYVFPREMGLAPQVDEDSGDIYGPPGTRVELLIAADKPIASASLRLDDGSTVPLAAGAASLEGALTIDGDGSYRIALVDHDGLENDGATEYYIRTLDDRPPNVRILRPASDRKVTPLEEVAVEARADDDYGVAALELVFQTPGGQARVVPFREASRGLTTSGTLTLFLEDLGVQPGDFVSYYARARDVNRGRRSREARSDLFFLEVKPFEEEFVAAQSQQMGQGGGPGGGLEELAEAQKQIVVATWNLDARARRAGGSALTADLKAVSKAQADLRERAEQASGQAARANDPRRRGRRAGPVPGEDPLGKAIESMGRAVHELDQARTSGALPHEMEALNHLLRAAAENRRRQVARGQQAGGGGGQNRAEADLSSLFDQELRRRQQTNYETPNSTETREETQAQDPLERIRELARRQDALNRQQRDLAQNRERLQEEELRRQLERLTREQNDLRQQAQQLAQQMQSGQPGAAGAQGSRQLREISEAMRNAATGMRQQDAGQAGESGQQAAQRLRELERQMQTARPDERRRALGNLQLETRQLADAERRLANEAARTAPDASGDDARRRLSAEQQRLADRARRLQGDVERLSKSGQGDADERRATEAAAQEIAAGRLAERMEQAAERLRQGAERGAEPLELARTLDRVADRLGRAAGQQAETRQFSEQLARLQELRDRMQQIDRSLEQIDREAGGRRSGTDAQAESRSPQQATGQQGASGSGQGNSSSQGREGASGQAGGTTGGSGGRAAELQRQVNEQMREAERLVETIRRDTPGLQPGNPEDGWWRSFSAPGTEAFKQDFSRWESLKKNLLVAIEGVESRVSDELRLRENQQRLNAGGHDAVSDAYRDLVEKYYRSLAAPRRPQ